MRRLFRIWTAWLDSDRGEEVMGGLVLTLLVCSLLVTAVVAALVFLGVTDGG